MTNKQLTDILSTVYTLGQLNTLAELMPETKWNRKASVLIAIKARGYKESDLVRWEKLGWIHPRCQGEKHPTYYLRTEVYECFLKEQLNISDV